MHLYLIAAVVLFGLGYGEIQLPTAVVLTRNRLKPLMRLLESIERSKPLNQTLNLHICCDVPAQPDEAAKETYLFVKELTWKRGTLTRVLHTKPQGLTAQWIDCWEPKSREETAVILEDDLELSPYALMWLHESRIHHRTDDDIVGFSLQRQTNCFHSACVSRQIDVPWTVREYKYVLVGTWGYSPLAKHWIAFQAWYRFMSRDPEYTPYVADIIPSGWYQSFKNVGRQNTMWEMWFIDYCNQHRLYTIYYNHPAPLTLGAHWAERGEHFDGAAPACDFNLVQHDFMPIERPKTALPPMWWDGKVNWKDDVKAQSIAIADVMVRFARHARVGLVTFVNYSFKDMTMHFICNIRAMAPELLSAMVIVTTDMQMYDAMIAARREGEGYVVMPLTMTTSTADEHLTFGTRHYYEMLVLRTEVLLLIIQHRVEFMLFECDAFVKENFVKSFVLAAKRTGADIVGIQDDNSDSNQQPNCGFLLFTNRPVVEHLWADITSTFADSLHSFKDSAPNDVIGVFNDQLIFRDLLAKNTHKIRVHLMDRLHYSSGQRLHFGDLSGNNPNISVALFNWVVGNKAKRARAFERKMWFYDEADQRCVNPLLQ